ncbi:unnamed protein product, partial [Adineta steineri]
MSVTTSKPDDGFELRPRTLRTEPSERGTAGDYPEMGAAP